MLRRHCFLYLDANPKPLVWTRRGEEIRACETRVFELLDLIRDGSQQSESRMHALSLNSPEPPSSE